MFAKIFSNFLKLAVLFVSVYVAYLFLTQTEIFANLFIGQSREIIEGVIVAPDFRINKISPVFPSPVQIEKDISSLIYEPLYRVYGNGLYDNILAEEIKLSEDKKILDIRLKQGVRWSDGIPFTSDDVITTFNAIKTLFITTSAQEILNEANIEKIDDYNLRLTFSRFEPTLLEDLSFGILPEHILKTEDVQRFRDHIINTEPLGTGPFVLSEITKDRVILKKNPYYRSEIKIDKFILRFFTDRQTLLDSLKNANIQLASTTDNQLFTEDDLTLNTSLQTNLSEIDSDSLLNRTFALYFNLKDLSTLPDDQKKIYQIYQDLNIRRAISLSIDRTEIIQLLGAKSLAAFRLYPEDSELNKDSSISSTLDLPKAKEILDSAGYIIDPTSNFRTKDGNKVSIEISFIDTPEKQKLMNSIKSQIEKLNIEVKLDPMNLTDLNGKLTSKTFGIILYGIESYFDMDRFKLWSENQISEVGLNISSFRSTQKVLDPITGKSESKLQDALLQGRSTLSDRIKWYRRVQNIIADEVPVIYLYHPAIQVIYNTRLQNIELTHITRPEDRYNSVYNWSYRE